MNNTLDIAGIVLAFPHSLDGLDARELTAQLPDARQDLPPIMLYRMRDRGTAVDPVRITKPK